MPRVAATLLTNPRELIVTGLVRAVQTKWRPCRLRAASPDPEPTLALAKTRYWEH